LSFSTLPYPLKTSLKVVHICFKTDIASDDGGGCDFDGVISRAHPERSFSSTNLASRWSRFCTCSRSSEVYCLCQTILIALHDLQRVGRVRVHACGDEHLSWLSLSPHISCWGHYEFECLCVTQVLTRQHTYSETGGV
jgi:hypothetical protein